MRGSADGKVMNTDKSGEKRGVTAAQEGCVSAQFRHEDDSGEGCRERGGCECWL